MKYLANPESLSGALRGVVLAVGGRFATQEVWEQLHERAKKTIDTAHKADLYRALTITRSEPLAKKALAIALTDEVPSRQSTRIVRDIAGGDFPELAWSFTQKNLQSLLPKLSALDANRYIPSMFAAFTDDERAQELEDYVKANFPPSAMRSALIVSEDIRFKAESKRRLLPQLHAWLK